MRQLSASIGVGTKSAVVLAFVAFALLAVQPAARAADQNAYSMTPLVSNVAGVAAVTDPHLVNAWGLDASPTSPWWVSDNGVDVTTLYRADGTKVGLEPGVAGAPTGLVFAGRPGNFLTGPSNAASAFIFSTEGGTINGWAGGMASAQVKVDESDVGAIYKGLAIANTPDGPMIYATDFARARVDVYNGAWEDVDTEGGFVDPMMPAGFAPFGIQTIGDRIFVTFAKQGVPEDGGLDEVAGQGLGFVDAFDTAGNLLVRVAQRGQLNAPWGLAMAPSSFGRFGGDLLVGNFADGEINAYEEMPNGHFEYRGVLRTSDGQPLVIDGLWALEFGHGATNNGLRGTLFFTAGPNDEEDGLFGSILPA